MKQRKKKLEGKQAEVISKYKKCKSLKETAKYFNVKDTRTIKQILIKEGVKIEKGQWNKKHSLYKHPLYNTWSCIKQRCFNSNNVEFKNYGKRGISIYKPWINNPQMFINYVINNMGEKPSGYSIDRINNNKNYEPGNIRWATNKQQARNKTTNIINKDIAKELRQAHISIRPKGSISVKQLAELYNLDYSYAKKVSRGEVWV